MLWNRPLQEEEKEEEEEEAEEEEEERRRRRRRRNRTENPDVQAFLGQSGRSWRSMHAPAVFSAPEALAASPGTVFRRSFLDGPESRRAPGNRHRKERRLDLKKNNSPEIWVRSAVAGVYGGMR